MTPKRYDDDEKPHWLREFFQFIPILRTFFVVSLALIGYAYTFGQLSANQANNLATIQADMERMKVELGKHEKENADSAKVLADADKAKHEAVMAGQETLNNRLSQIAVDISAIKTNIQWLKDEKGSKGITLGPDTNKGATHAFHD